MLQAAAGMKIAEIDGREAEALQQIADDTLCGHVVAGDEQDAFDARIRRRVREQQYSVGVERLDDPRPGRVGCNDFACLVKEVPEKRPFLEKLGIKTRVMELMKDPNALVRWESLRAVGEWLRYTFD